MNQQINESSAAIALVALIISAVAFMIASFGHFNFVV